MMSVFDADGHIIEPEEMFAEMEAEFYPNRPLMVPLPLDTARGKRDACWIVGGQALPSLDGKGPNFFLAGDSHSQSMTASVQAQTLQDVKVRLADLDRMGIHNQVIFPTLFLVAVAEDPRLEAALFRAYNNYVKRACDRSGGRLKWVALIPLRDPALAEQELRRASDMGAAAVLTLGMSWNLSLHEPSFLPIFRTASELDLPVCVHFGWGSKVLTDLFAGSNTSFCSATTPVLWSFYYLMLSGVLDRLPKLKLGFLESGAGWVPYVIDQVRRRIKPHTVLIKDRSAARSATRDPLDYFKEDRVFVAGESEEDLSYLVSRLGEDCLMMASDYPHGDASADEEFVKSVQVREDLSPTAKEKILGGNAERFYRC